MEPQKRWRVSKIVLATALFLVVSFNSPPTIPSIPEGQPPPPSPQEVAVLEELADWVLGANRADRFRVTGGLGVAATVRRRPQSFELFRSYNDDSARQELIRGFPYGDLIASAARRHRLDGLLLASVVEVESGFDAQAVSPDGALGLMQIMPPTASLFTTTDPIEPADNLDVGARYLRILLRQFDGDLPLALAAYNAGPGNVERYKGIPPFGETRSYVQKVLDRYIDHHRTLWQSSRADLFLY